MEAIKSIIVLFCICTTLLKIFEAQEIKEDPDYGMPFPITVEDYDEGEDEDKIVHFDDSDTLEAGDKCDPGDGNHTAPFYFTKCLRLRQCPVLLEEWKAGRKMSVCLHSTEISEMLVCCTHEQYIQSKIFLMNRPQKITYKANYLDFKNCLRRQAEFSSDEFEIYNAPGAVLPSGGAYEVNPKYYKHMAAVGWTSKSNESQVDWDCGGVLITPRHILTAAHCSFRDGSRPDTIRLGDINLLSKNDDEGVQQLKIANITKHPDYASSSYYNDIAVIKLAGDVILNDKVVPICLQSVWEDKGVGFEYEAAGYGHTEYLGEKANRLLGVTLKLVDKAVCQQNFEGLPKLKNGILDTQLCATSHEIQDGRSMDTCNGDSGGPYQYVKKIDFENILYDVPVLVGLTSFGIGCSIPNQPSVYTNVVQFIPWIESVVIKDL